MKLKKPVFAALAFDLAGQPAAEIQLLPAGEFAARDGRPGPGLVWRLDAVIAERVIQRFAARKNPAVIDYEHQTMHASYKDGVAPAAGWFSGLRFDAAGLWATGVTWTTRATDMIGASEYRYISAVFSYLPDSGEILEIYNAGLTNDPALDGMAEVFQYSAAARFNFPQNQPTETTVHITQLIALLGLDADADEATVLAALTARLDIAAKADGLKTEIAALRAANPDPARFAPVAVVEALRVELAALTLAQREREITELVEAALSDGRLSPAQTEWACELGQNNIAALRGYITTAQPIAALRGSQTGGKPPATATDAHRLTAEQLAICKNCNIAPDEYAKLIGLAAA